MARRKLDKQKLKLEFLERLTAGESHTAITDDPHMPDWSTVYRWAKADKEFAADIARHGAANAIRQRAARALQLGFHHTARHQNAIADILDGVTP